MAAVKAISLPDSGFTTEHALELPENDHDHYDPRFIRVRAFNSHFIGVEKAKSSETRTVWIDFDGVLAHWDGKNHSRNGEFFNELLKLKENNVRLILWSGGGKERIRKFLTKIPSDICLTGRRWRRLSSGPQRIGKSQGWTMGGTASGLPGSFA